MNDIRKSIDGLYGRLMLSDTVALEHFDTCGAFAETLRTVKGLAVVALIGLLWTIGNNYRMFV
jgi:hypothetical protein